MNGVVHFEIPVDDMSRARTFYKTVFDWKLQDFPMPDGSTYVGVHTTPIDEKTHMPKEPGAINGGMMMRTEDVCTPVFAVNVPSVDAALRAVEKAGGRIVKPKIEIGGMGFYAYVTDSEGNVVGLWENKK